MQYLAIAFGFSVCMAIICICEIVLTLCRRKTNKVQGSLRIDLTDPDDAPYIFLELDSSIEEVLNEEYVTLKVIPRK